MKANIIVLLVFVSTLFSLNSYSQEQGSHSEMKAIVGKEFLADQFFVVGDGSDSFYVKQLDKNGKTDSVRITVNEETYSYHLLNNSYLVNGEGDTLLVQESKNSLSSDIKVESVKKRKPFKKDLQIDYYEKESNRLLTSIECEWNRKEDNYNISITYSSTDINSINLAALSLARLDKERITSDFDDVMDPYIDGFLFGVFSSLAMIAM